MELTLTTASAARFRADCLLAPVLPGAEQPPDTAALDRACGGAISRALKSGDITGKPGQCLLLRDLPGLAAARLLLVGMGEPAAGSPQSLAKSATAAARALAATGSSSALVLLAGAPLRRHGAAWRLQQLAMHLADANWRTDELKSRPAKPASLRRLHFAPPSGLDAATARQALTQAQAIVAGTQLTRRLGNLPANICTPDYLAREARALARRHRLTVLVHTPAQIHKMGMGAFMAVARASHEPARLITLHWRGGPRTQAPIALIGKGITFDTGGISLKPADKMDEMKYDMCGAASVLGALEVCARLKLPLNVTGIIPATENMPGGRATRPGDIVTSLSGQSIEILNTDAEGRLILCDALTYARRFKPAAVVDIATLTGACVVALGRQAHGLFSGSEALAQALLSAGETSGDRAWRLPLWEDYQDLLDSNFADMANIGGREGGAITAACFLSRFTHGLEWAHLDIAGTAWKTGGKDKGATGRPVPLLAQFLLERAGKSLK
jgi:leucyl aminopeptidase